MHWASVILGGTLGLLISLPRLGKAYGAEGVPDAAPKPRMGIAVWDTSQPSALPLAPAALAGKNTWRLMPTGQTPAALQGDAVLSNGQVMAVVRKQDAALQMYAVGAGGVVARARLRLATGAGEPAIRLDRVTLVENTRSAACLDAVYKTAQGAEVAAKFRLKRGDVALQTEPGPGAARLRVEAAGRFLVLPDFFADDIVIDARKIPLSDIEVPSENFLLHLTGQGDAIAMCVFENRQQDVKVTLAGTEAQRDVKGSDIGFEGKKIWVALLEGAKLWHMVDVRAEHAGQVRPLGWKMPFPAQWRVDFTRPNDLTDSWEMLLQEKTGSGYVKPSWLGSGDEHVRADRRRWNTVLDRYPYPCWSDQEGTGFVQPLKHSALQFQGPALLYPINRVKETPLAAFTVVDVMRNTLGTGPCEHILDLEGQKAELKGRATCSVRDRLGEIYGAGQQKARRVDVEKLLNEGLVFVTHIRGRITRYVEFGHRMRAYLAEQRKLRPDLAAFIVEMEKITREIDARVAARADKIQTPAHVAQMNEQFRRNVLDYNGPDALEKCKAYATALVVIGDNQDELSGECRWVVKTLRQRAGILMALDPRVAPIAGEIRARTQEALRNPATHEGARH